MRRTPQVSIHVSGLIVGPEGSDRTLLVEALSGLGIVTQAVAEFPAARELLATRQPDLLITDVRLGAYNGLHLVLHGKIMRPTMKAIVLTRAEDPVLRQEAALLDAVLLVKDGDAGWVAGVLATLGPIALGGKQLTGKPGEGA